MVLLPQCFLGSEKYLIEGRLEVADVHETGEIRGKNKGGSNSALFLTYKEFTTTGNTIMDF